MLSVVNHFFLQSFLFQRIFLTTFYFLHHTVRDVNDSSYKYNLKLQETLCEQLLIASLEVNIWKFSDLPTHKQVSRFHSFENTFSVLKYCVLNLIRFRFEMLKISTCLVDCDTTYCDAVHGQCYWCYKDKQSKFHFWKYFIISTSPPDVDYHARSYSWINMLATVASTKT